MADTVVIADDRAENTGFRFSWGLAIAGGVAATAVTFFLLSLGSGFGLLLVNPQTHSGPSMPVFLTGGAIYFVAAQAFGFAVGGHIAGRLIGPLAESKPQEEFRAEAHGLMAWAVAVLGTLTMVAIVGLSAANTGATVAALYGASTTKTEATPTAYLVDVLFRPAQPATADSVGSPGARAEAGRIVESSVGLGMKPAPSDRSRLIGLIAANAKVSPDESARRIDTMQRDTKAKLEHAANVARKAASYTALWIALSLLLGALVSVTAAIMAREEDDQESLAV
jgi:hypothetical protein